MCDFDTHKLLAMPKSVRWASKSLSNKILDDFTSRWMIRGLQSWCKYDKPCAAPSAIISRVSQSNIFFLVGPAYSMYGFTVIPNICSFPCNIYILQNAYHGEDPRDCHFPCSHRKEDCQREISSNPGG